MGHRAGHLDAFNFSCHGRRFQQADPDRQIKLIVRVLENNDRRLGDWIQGQAADGHLNRIFPFAHATSPSDWNLETCSAVTISPSSELAVAPTIRTGSKQPTQVSSPVKFTIRLLCVRPVICPFFSLDFPSPKISSTLPILSRFFLSDISRCKFCTSFKRSFLISSSTFS